MATYRGENMQNRRTLLSVAGTGALVTAIALMPKAVRAENQVAFEGTLTVQAVVSQQCASGVLASSQCVAPPVNGLFVDAQGIAETTLGPLFAKVLKCFNPNSTAQAPYGTYAGTLTLNSTPPVTQPSLLAAP